MCGITNGETFYDDNHPPLGDEIDEDYPDLCPSGQDVVNFVYDPVLEQWTRQCQWPNGDPGLQCVAYEDHCGDGITQTTFGETCDDGNNLPNDGCSPTCQLEEP